VGPFNAAVPGGFKAGGRGEGNHVDDPACSLKRQDGEVSLHVPGDEPIHPARAGENLAALDQGLDVHIARTDPLGGSILKRKLHKVRLGGLKPEGNLGSVCKHLDRKSTRLNSSHVKISYAVFCLKKKKKRK